jgi:hypothetical protein
LATTATNLDTEAIVDLGHTVVILPDDTELENALGHLNDFKRLLVMGVRIQEGLEGSGQFIQSLYFTGEWLRHAKRYSEHYAPVGIRVQRVRPWCLLVKMEV